MSISVREEVGVPKASQLVTKDEPCCPGVSKLEAVCHIEGEALSGIPKVSWFEACFIGW